MRAPRVLVVHVIALAFLPSGKRRRQTKDEAIGWLPIPRRARAAANLEAALLPDRPRGVHHQRELGAFILLRDGVAGDRGGKAGLRADRESVEVDEACRLAGAAPERVEAFERGGLAADQP